MLFDGCVVAELLKNEHQLSLTSFLDCSSRDKHLLFWWLTWNENSLVNIKQGWVPSGWCGGFRPNILSILVLIRIRINLWQQRPSEHHNNHSTILLEKRPQIAVFHNCATILHSSTSFAGSQFYWTLPSSAPACYHILLVWSWVGSRGIKLT